MESGELMETRLIAGGVIAAVSLWFVLARHVDLRRRRRFDALAQVMGGEVVAETGHRWLFAVQVSGRPVEVRYWLLPKGPWHLVTSVSLAGVSELHAVDIRPRLGARVIDGRDADFERQVAVHDLGLPLREGWLQPGVRGALGHLFAHPLAGGTLSIEEGRLVLRSAVSLPQVDAGALRQLLDRLVATAAAVERAL
jgi:hypothetical protein